VKGVGYYYIIIICSFLAWTPLGTARYTRPEHSGREAWADVNTGLELISGTLAGGLVLEPPTRIAHSILLVAAAEASGLLEFVHHLLHLLHPPVGVDRFSLEGPGVVVVVPVTSTTSVVIVVVPVASTASVVGVVPPVSPGPAVITPPGGGRSPVPPSCAPRSSSLESSVPRRSVRSRAGITAVLGLSGVSLTRGVGLPGAVLGTGGPDRRTDRTEELTESSWEVERTVTRYTGTDARHLLLHPGLVLDTARDVRPGAVRLTLRDIVPASSADHSAGVTNVGLGAVAREPGTCHQAGHGGRSFSLER